MRRLKRYILTLSTIVLSILSAWVGYDLYSQVIGREDNQHDDLTTYRSYWIAPNQTLSFSIQAGKRNLRLLLNGALADVSRAGITQRDEQFFSVHYRILDSSGALLDERTYYLPLRVTLTEGRAHRALLDHPATPADTNLVYLNLTTPAAATRLELSMGPRSRSLSGMTLRPYFQERRADNKLDRIWQRLHANKQQFAARNNVFDLEFLTPEERRNLVRWRWRPLVPMGIEDQDYTVQILADQPPEQVEAISPNISQHWFLAAGRSTTLGLPSKTHLLVTAIGAANTRLTNADLSMRWQGRFAYEREHIDLEHSMDRLQTRTTLPRGLVEFIAHKDMWIELADLEHNTPLLPQVSVVRAYRLDSEPLSIPVRHAADTPTPVRIDVRAKSEQKTLSVNIAYLSKGKLVGEARIDTELIASSSDWLVIRGDRQPISNPARVYLNVLPAIDEIRLTSSTAAWLSAYNRPPALSRHTLIPEALFGGNEETALLPNWFVLAPAASDTLINGGASATIESQLKPRPDSKVAAELRQFERLLPLEPTSGTLVLAANDPRQPRHATAAAATYVALQRGQQTLRLIPASRNAEVSPTLLLKQDGPAGRVTIRDAQKTIVDMALDTNSTGRIQLPPLQPGKHIWTVDAPPGTSLWVNRAANSEGSYREHSVQALPEKHFNYTFNRHAAEQESLAIRVFSDSPGRVRLKLKFTPWAQPVPPVLDWSSVAVIYDLTLEQEFGAIAPFAQNPALPYGAIAIHQLGIDVPPGNMQAVISVEQLDMSSSSQPNIYLGFTRSSANELAAPIKVQRFEVSQR